MVVYMPLVKGDMAKLVYKLAGGPLIVAQPIA